MEININNCETLRLHMDYDTTPTVVPLCIMDHLSHALVPNHNHIRFFWITIWSVHVRTTQGILTLFTVIANLYRVQRVDIIYHPVMTTERDKQENILKKYVEDEHLFEVRIQKLGQRT